MPIPPTLAYASGDHTVEAAVSNAVTSSPFNGVNSQVVLTQDFVIYRDNFNPLALNTPHAVFPQFLLAQEGDRSDIGGGLVKWKRTYIQIPASRSEYAGFAYRFIGLMGKKSSTNSYVGGRGPFVKPTTVRIQYDYYLVDGVTISNPQDIPVIEEQLYFVPLGSIDTSSGVPVFVPVSNSSSLADARGVATDFLWDTTGPFAIPGNVVPTKPTRTEYDTMRLNHQEICVEASQVSRWLGNFYQRVTKYVIAQ